MLICVRELVCDVMKLDWFLYFEKLSLLVSDVSMVSLGVFSLQPFERPDLDSEG